MVLDHRSGQEGAASFDRAVRGDMQLPVKILSSCFVLAEYFTRASRHFFSVHARHDNNSVTVGNDDIPRVDEYSADNDRPVDRFNFTSPGSYPSSFLAQVQGDFFDCNFVIVAWSGIGDNAHCTETLLLDVVNHHGSSGADDFGELLRMKR